MAEITLIIPTLNEAANLPPLVARVAAAMAAMGPRHYEVLVVDDASPDDTAAVCRSLADDYPVRLIVRADPKDGLSGAVLHGLAAAEGDWLVVMDADLQHPPERIGDLLAALDDGADFAIGSRHVDGGSIAPGWGRRRRVTSWAAARLARPFAGPIRDPMSGFFALRRSTYRAAEHLSPLGFKVGLELLCKCRARRVREVPIHFGVRTRGRSKLTVKQQFRYLEHLSRLYDFFYPRLSPVLKFGIATGCAWFVAHEVYMLLLRNGIGLVAAPVLAYAAAIAVTSAFFARYVHTQREFLLRPHPWRDFAAISLAEWLACGLAAVWIVAHVPVIHPAERFLTVFGAATVVRYALRKEFLQDIRGLGRDARRPVDAGRATPSAVKG